MEIDRNFLANSVGWFYLISFLYVFAVQSIYLAFLISAVKSLRKYLRTLRARRVSSTGHNDFLPPVTIIVPAYNEALTIVENIKGFLKLEYPKYEIMVVNDGSKDDTMHILTETFRLIPIDQVYAKKLQTRHVRRIYHSLMYPNLVVVDKENGGKADAINAGINVSQYPLFCVVDADSILETKSLVQVVYPFVENPNEVVAVGGIVRLVNGCRVDDGEIREVKLSSNHWVRMQALEYLRAFLIGRIAWSEMNSLLIIAGAFGMFKKSAVIDVGGYLTETVGEDVELTVRLHRHSYEKRKKWRILFIPNPICWTQAPEDRESLKRQRNRWHRGLAEALWRHRIMFLNPRYGIVGLISMPYFVLVEWLGPLFEFFWMVMIPLTYLFGLLNGQLALGFLAVALVYSQIVSVGALLLEEYNFRRYTESRDLLLLFFYSFLENFYFRPLQSWWKVQAIFQVRKKKFSWGEMKRISFGE